MALTVSSATNAGGPDVLLTPIIEIRSSEIITCGVRSEFADRNAEVEVGLRKGSDGPHLFLRAGVRGKRLSQISVNTASVGPDELFGSPHQSEDGKVERRAETNAPKASIFMQEFFVSGAEVVLIVEGDEHMRLSIPGPSSNSVRMAYLGCAGDFFR